MSKRLPLQQRALWMFLLATLLGPMLAAAGVLLASLVMGLAGHAPPAPNPEALDAAGRLSWSASWAAGRALSAYVWSALPAGLAGLVLAAAVWRGGCVTWLAAAIAGAVSASLFAVLGGPALTAQLTPIAFLGASAATGVWALARRLRIVDAPAAEPAPAARRRKR